MNTTSRLQQVLDMIDQANALDPNTHKVGDSTCPTELVYGERMTAALDAFCDDPSEHLQIAVRGQHIERWKCPRDSYPDGRTGYLRWRSDLKAYHARRTGELMHAAGYGEPDIERVGILIGKKGIKRDPEVQMLEDVACLVFLEHYAGDFVAKHDDEKVAGILGKTIRKMSADGIAAAGRLTLPERLARLLAQTLN